MTGRHSTWALCQVDIRCGHYARSASYVGIVMVMVCVIVTEEISLMEAAPRHESLVGRNFSDGAADLDLLDQLLSRNGWLEFPDCPDVLQAGTPYSMSPLSSLSFSPLFEIDSSSSNPDRLERCSQDDIGGSVASACPPGDETLAEKFDRTQSPKLIFSIHSGVLKAADLSSKAGTRWSIQPRDSNFYVKERFMQALYHIKDAGRDSEVLVQLWVPVKRGDQLILTTCSQPFSVNPNCVRLMNYREVSTNYHFSAQENSGKVLGLPGRVFLGRLPEWTPDVRFFSSYEYPRVDYAQRLDIRGSIAIPVFDQGSRSCLGVVEVVMTTQKLNYSVELEKICNALRAVDLRSSAVASVPRFKVGSGSYQAALPEILEVLKAVCRMHMLPLAQTWIPCIQQGKRGIRHSDENYRHCVSTSDAAYYVNDPSMTGFHEACSEHHLLRGQGVAGRAFTTNQPCFVSDVTASSKMEYPLSHHAKMFGLRGAVAICMRSILSGNADFVLEFFLPTNCILIEEQKQMLDSLSGTIQQFCRTLRVVTSKELADENMLQLNEMIPHILLEKSSSEAEPAQKYDTVTSLDARTKKSYRNLPPWFTSTMKNSVQKRGHTFKFKKPEAEGFSIATETGYTEEVLPAADTYLKLGHHRQGLSKDVIDIENSFNFNSTSSGAAKTTARRRRKSERTVSLEVLRTHFAGSLKDAAKNIGVCPTTLKRICRQHGITRWPSRIIKKVDHSLQKLRVVIDSVHGADKSIQLSSLYKDFTTASVSDKNSSGEFVVSKSNQNDHPNADHQYLDAELNQPHLSSSYSSTSWSQTPTSNLSSSSGKKKCSQPCEPRMIQEVNLEEKVVHIPQGTNSQIGLHLSAQSTQLIPGRFESQKSPVEHCSPACLSRSDNFETSSIRVKVMYGAEKVRIRLHPTWGFKDLRQEILKRFNIGNQNSVNLRYIDDELEWILLTCDADLQECLCIYRSSGAQTIKITLQSVDNPQL
ncbi:hypothetical protein OPV22_009455 [Ensete ventricosum]|uniref:RWP-RK domain-containing protein n=1 Tax=Ensete ventricosum TaxID=4639 RepID=A0AAV8RFZ0_ENSVE|nr:hypothetical protein OPV22_009455 [Ensete ventricosum]